MKPKAIDLFCCAGGASMGLSRAGFEVVGVDIKPQPNYPFKFIQGDALEADLRGFHFVWASPPCQKFSTQTKCRPEADHPDLIEPIRKKLIDSGLPYVIENVPGAPLINPIMLCGKMFPDLRVYRHRLFECSFFVLEPSHPSHGDSTPKAGRGISPNGFISIAGHCGNAAYAKKAMGIDWMNRNELAQSIPPVYSEWLGNHVLKLLNK
jgi:DNA (cytosine-5)-methyltransferase 1